MKTYKYIPATDLIKIRGKQSHIESIKEYQAAINREASDGWEYVGTEELLSEYNPGCVMALLGNIPVINLFIRKQETIAFKNLVFQKGEASFQPTINPEIKNKLLVAYEENDVEAVENLIKQGNNLNLQDNEGKSILFFAVEKKDEKTIKLLLESGADLKLQNNAGFTPTILAKLTDENCLKILEEHGSVLIDDINSANALHSIYKIDPSGKTLEQFLIPGVDINKKDNHDTTLIHSILINHGEIDLLKKILSFEGFDINISSQGYTPLLQAIREGNNEIAKIFIENHKPDLYIKSANGNDALDLALSKNNIEMIEFLLSNGYDKEKINIENAGIQLKQIIKKKQENPDTLKAYSLLGVDVDHIKETIKTEEIEFKKKAKIATIAAVGVVAIFLLGMLISWLFRDTTVYYGTIIEPAGIRFRKEANIDSEKLDILPLTTDFKIIDRNEDGDKEVHNDREGRWVKIEYKGQKGWVFDPFIRVYKQGEKYPNYLRKSHADKYKESVSENSKEASQKLFDQAMKQKKYRQNEKAAQNFVTAIENYPTPEYYYEYGNALLNLKNYDEAKQAYRLSIYLNYDKKDLSYYNIACAESLSYNKGPALEYIELAIKHGYKHYNHIRRDPDLKWLRWKVRGFNSWLRDIWQQYR